jgi:hypothetical protein
MVEVLSPEQDSALNLGHDFFASLYAKVVDRAGSEPSPICDCKDVSGPRLAVGFGYSTRKSPEELKAEACDDTQVLAFGIVDPAMLSRMTAHFGKRVDSISYTSLHTYRVRVFSLMAVSY